jgi:hypothetical protein
VRRTGIARRPQDRLGAAAYASARAKAYERALGACEGCGARLERTAFHAHHRLPRSPRRVDCPCNLLALCGRCHGEVHEAPTESTRTGRLIVRTDRRIPSEVPVVIAGAWWLLGCDGTRTALTSLDQLPSVTCDT